MPSAVGTLVNSVFTRYACKYGSRTNGKLPSIHSESVPRSWSKASTYNYAEKQKLFQGMNGVLVLLPIDVDCSHIEYLSLIDVKCTKSLGLTNLDPQTSCSFQVVT